MSRHRKLALRTLLIFTLAGCGWLVTLGCGGGVPGEPPTPTVSNPPNDAPDVVSARVHSVIDGATIEVEIDGRIRRVRYLGVEIPGPEAAATEGESEVRAGALEFNKFLVEGRIVQLEADTVDSDPAGNILRYVYVGGEMVNKVLLTNGYATVAEFPLRFQYQTEFLRAEESAKTNLRGIWEPRSSESNEQGSAVSPEATPVPAFGEGTLPDPGRALRICDFSETTESVIKGNVDSATGVATYHPPGSLFYASTVVDESQGDRWFCLEEEATAAGFKKSSR